MHRKLKNNNKTSRLLNRPKRANPFIKWFLLILIAVLLTVGGFWFYNSISQYFSTDYALTPLEMIELGLSYQDKAEENDPSAKATGYDNLTEETPQPVNDGITARLVEKGDTAGGILNEWLEPTEVHQIVNICQEVYPLAKIKSGQPYSIFEDENGFYRFEYQISDNQKLVVCREAQSFTATLENVEYDILLTKIDGVIKSNLFSAMDATGENSVLAIAMADVFAWEINFIKDLRVGDSFSVIVEKRYKDGEFKSYGQLLATRFINNGKIYEAFQFEDVIGDPQYFTHEGESVKHAFLKAPLSFSRISSGFSKSRLHPILNEYRAHPGIDYAAPTGTPVKAIGNGTVTYAGWGKGAGNYVALQHINGYETTYMHLSAFANGISKGMKVRQGEVIGYVGSTGYSTGPHLDFRMKKNGTFINPLEALSPRDLPISTKNIQAFKEYVFIHQEYLSGDRPLTD